MLVDLIICLSITGESKTSITVAVVAVAVVVVLDGIDPENALLIEENPPDPAVFVDGKSRDRDEFIIVVEVVPPKNCFISRY